MRRVPLTVIRDNTAPRARKRSLPNFTRWQPRSTEAHFPTLLRSRDWSPSCVVVRRYIISYKLFQIMGSRKRKIADEGRMFNDEWKSKYFFIENEGKPLCLICHNSVAVMKEYNIRRHYENEHESQYKDLTCELRINKINKLQASLTAQQSFFKKQSIRNESIVRASYVVAELVAKEGRPYTDSEFIKKCLLAVAEQICPEKKTLFQDISLSARTCTRRVEEIGINLFEQLKVKAKSFDCFALAMDESNDVTDTAQLLIFIRGIDSDFNVHEELASLCSLKGTTTGNDLFIKVKETIASLELDWKKLKSVTTDGGRNMCGSNTGVVGRICAELQNLGCDNPMVFHCIIHQEALCCKILSSMNDVMDTVISTVNYIRRNGLKHRKFQEFLLEMDSEYTDVIYYSAVRWLSRGAVLKRFFHLREEIDIFMTEHENTVPQLSDKKWIMSLAFMVDITTYLNELNVNLQGQCKLLAELFADIKAFEAKLCLLKKHLIEENLHHFACCKSVSALEWQTQKETFVGIIDDLQKEFSKRFVDFHKHSIEMRLFLNPFNVDIDDVPNQLQMEVLEIQHNETLKNAFSLENIKNFYRCLPKKFEGLSSFAKKMIVAFGSTYICEQAFSAMSFRKNKFSSRLSDEHLHASIRICTSGYKVDIDNLAKEKQPQMSH